MYMDFLAFLLSKPYAADKAIINVGSAPKMGDNLSRAKIHKFTIRSRKDLPWGRTYKDVSVKLVFLPFDENLILSMA